MSDVEVANAIEAVNGVIADMRAGPTSDLNRELLQAFYGHDLDQASKTIISPLNVEELADRLGLSRDVVGGRIRRLISDGLLEPYMETFGEAAEEGHARITERGREEIEDQG